MADVLTTVALILEWSGGKDGTVNRVQPQETIPILLQCKLKIGLSALSPFRFCFFQEEAQGLRIMPPCGADNLSYAALII